MQALDRRTIVIVGGAVATLLVASVLALSGPRIGSDTAVFRQAADHLLAGDGIPGKRSGYSAYVVLVALSDMTGAGDVGLVVLQILVAAVGAAAVVRLALWLGGIPAGVVSAALFASYLDVHRWHAYILSDSLFISAIPIVAVLVVLADRRGGWWQAGAAVAIVVTALLRPNGWLIALVAVLYLVLRRLPDTRTRIAVTLAVAAIGASLLFTSPVERAIAYEDPAQHLRDGTVIWGEPDGWVEMPEGPGGEGVAGLVRYTFTNPAASLELGARRVGTALAQVRPYYSRSHNLLLAAQLAVIYPLAIIGAITSRRRGVTVLLVSIVGIQLAFIGLTFADYDGRFMAYVLPLVIAFAGAGAGWSVRWTASQLPTGIRIPNWLLDQDADSTSRSSISETSISPVGG